MGEVDESEKVNQRSCDFSQYSKLIVLVGLGKI